MHKYYKQTHIIAFYDSDDDTLLHIFNNVREIAKFKNQTISRQNINILNVELYRALKRASHSTRMLTGCVMKVHIIDITKNY